MGVWLWAIRYSLVREKWRQPKNPRWALSGDGCGARRIRCLPASISGAFFWACAPHSINTMFSRSRDQADYGLVGKLLPAASRVRCRSVGLDGERRVEQQHTLLGPAAEITVGWNGAPVSSCTSLKILTSDGGIGWPGLTESTGRWPDLRRGRDPGRESQPLPCRTDMSPWPRIFSPPREHLRVRYCSRTEVGKLLEAWRWPYRIQGLMPRRLYSDIHFLKLLVYDVCKFTKTSLHLHCNSRP